METHIIVSDNKSRYAREKYTKLPHTSTVALEFKKQLYDKIQIISSWTKIRICESCCDRLGYYISLQLIF